FPSYFFLLTFSFLLFPSYFFLLTFSFLLFPSYFFLLTFSFLYKIKTSALHKMFESRGINHQAIENAKNIANLMKPILLKPHSIPNSNS
ncbi:hypothetical protein, partial [Okeania sp.]|uniref:hypothetical protein n=1 Tax=Okeania sp. TaxID=3100323 RepID=UPI002B4AB111